MELDELICKEFIIYPFFSLLDLKWQIRVQAAIKKLTGLLNFDMPSQYIVAAAILPRRWLMDGCRGDGCALRSHVLGSDSLKGVSIEPGRLMVGVTVGQCSSSTF